MRLTSVATSLALATGALAAVPLPPSRDHQHPLVDIPTAVATAMSPSETGVGHFSEWSRETKRQFLIDWQAGRSHEWIVVAGNQAGDLDSMAAALTWAYHLEHSTINSSTPIKAIALLQTPTDALDLRPENKIALDNSQMSSGHSDLLTIDELPEDPETLATHIKGIVIVDHPKPVRTWQNAPILSIFDHHKDVGAGADAQPRIFETVASCTTLVARQMLDELEALPEEYHMPHELLELVLSAIAIDSGGLADGTKEDRKTAQRILDRSNWRNKKLDKQMEKLDSELSDAKKDLDDLTLRDLLRRDWKGDLIDTPSERTPTVNLGAASIPYSLDYQITRTGFGELFDWFATHAAWTAQAGSDISIVLTKYKVKTKDVDMAKKKRKIREIILVVRNDVRIDEAQADELFNVVKTAIESDKTLNVKPWHRADELGRWQMAWTHEDSDAGRKVVWPIVEAAVKSWE